ncbi:MAG: PilZ domain-containing protein [Spongiibacteraceae bacterium]
MNNGQIERRRYFRIDDSMGITYRKLGPEEAKAFALQTQQHGSNFDFAANFDNRIQTLLESCRIQAPIAAELIDLINKKLNFVIRQMDIDTELIHQVAYTVREVNVSACGIAFVNEEYLEKGQQLQLDIVLQPSELHVVVMAEVIECASLPTDSVAVTPTEQERYYLRLNFSEINPHDQELLIQHIMKRQSAVLKQRRRGQSV